MLAGADALPALRDLVFELVPTLGVREYPVTKRMLARYWQTVSVGAAEVRIKVGHRDGRITTATPEFSDVVAAAEASGRPVREVLAEADAAASAVACLVAGGDVPPDNGP